MAPLIRAVLSKLIGEDDAKDIEIVSNEVDVRPDGTWEIKYRHPTRSVSVSVSSLGVPEQHAINMSIFFTNRM